MQRLAARLAPAGQADDVVQEALIRAWRKRGQFDPGRGSASAWLLAIVADRARSARVRTVSEERFEDVDLPVHADRPGDVDLERALARLTERQRLAVDCVYFAGLTVAETAAVMDCAAGTVKSTLSDARRRLREMLEES
jgi:RNA polymerase sigma-70 factor (ECF subfamily)